MTSSEPREVAVPKYFRKTPTSPNISASQTKITLGIAAIVIGVIAGLVSVLAEDPSFLCCAGFALPGGAVLALVGYNEKSVRQRKYDEEYKKAVPKPSDQQMDDWLSSDIDRTVAGALDKMGMVREQVINANDPLIVKGPLSRSRFAPGEDGIFRFSAYEIVVIYLSNYHLGAYTCHLDFATGKLESEQTQEYHYADVVSVATLTNNSGFTVTTTDGEEHQLPSHQEFTLSVASGQSIKVAVAFPHAEEILKGEWAPSGAERAINTVRTMLREKKGGI